MEAIVSDDLYKPEEVWHLHSVHVTAGNLVKPTATVTLNDKDGNEISQAAMGTGPVDAIFLAIDKALDYTPQLNEYIVNSITDGSSALGDVTVRIQEASENGKEQSQVEEIDFFNPQTETFTKRQFVGHGANTDILVASASAYINAMNRLLAAKENSPNTEPKIASA